MHIISKQLQAAAQAWPHVTPNVTPILFVPRNEAEYDRLVSILNQLIDQVGSDELHPLASLMDVVGALVEQYDDQHHADPFS
jgi:HTH-type transcriptional regulator / antitoxin HigA